MTDQNPDLANLPIDLQRDAFLRTLLRHLTGTLQDVVGLEQASGFVSVVGREMGEELNQLYCSALKVERLSLPQVAQSLQDLKQRIHGNFTIESMDADKIVLKTDSCPFEDKVIGRPSLCMMTTNVFGTITSQNLGYAKVELSETIATGSSGCHVVVYLTDSQEARDSDGIEYFRL